MEGVFPARAGVILTYHPYGYPTPGLSRTSGSDPISSIGTSLAGGSFPHERE